MKIKNSLANSKLLWLGLATTGYLFSQMAHAQDSDTADDTVYELSPFVVSESDSIGYLATSTLAGTRIKTDLRDLGGAISVVTPEFMEDTGATDIESLLTYTLGTEVGGVQGNFSAADLANAGRPNMDEVQRSPQTSARVRGLGRPNYTRSYFSTNIPIDGYNTGGITISRGPNSILFGLGEPSGVIDAGLLNAQLGKDSQKFQIRFDSNGSLRMNVDFNESVLNDRLAVRFSALDEDTKFRQEEASDEEKRAYLAFNGVLFKNEKSKFLGRTSIRGNFESGDGQRTPPTNMAPVIAYESFFMPPPDYRSYNGGRDYPQTYDHLSANWAPWTIIDSRRIDNGDGSFSPGWYEQPGNAHPDYSDDLVTPIYATPHIFTQIGLVYSGDGDPSLHSNGDTIFSGWIPASFQAQSPFLQTRIYTEQANGTGFRPFNLTDQAVFDYKNHLITGDLHEINTEFDNYNISLEQQFFDGKAGVEATFGEETFYIDYFQPFGGGARNQPIYIDTTMYLSDGRLNPNAGRAMLFTNGVQERWRETQRENSRVTAYGDFDFADLSDGWMKWLGRHRFTGLYQVEERRQIGMNEGTYWGSETENMNRVINNNGSNNKRAFFAQTVGLAYISDSLVGLGMDEVRLSPANINMWQEGDMHTGTIFNRQANQFEEHTVRIDKYFTGATGGGEDVESRAFAWQPYILNEHIVGMFGWRRDEIDSFGKIFPERRDPVTNEVLEDNMRIEQTSTIPAVGDTFTWSVVGHMPDKWLGFQNVITSLSAHYSEAENFSAIRQRHDIFNNEIASPQGLTEEMGFSVGFADDKWLIRVNKFETSSANNDTLNAQTGNAQSWIGGWLNRYQEGENSSVPFDTLPISQAGYSSYADVYQAIINLQPEPAKSIYAWEYDTAAEEWDNTGSIQSLNSVTNTVAKGWEVDITGNPTRNWRVKLGISKIETSNSNTAQPLFEYSSQLMANLASANLIGIPEGVNSIVPFEQRYTSLVLTDMNAERAKDGAVSQELREWHANFVSTYGFTEGRLKGFSVGGAIRWGSSVTIGYEQLVDEFGNLIPNLNKPFKGDDDLRGDLWFSYGKKLAWADWKIQLNVRNALGTQKDIPISANPDGQRSLYRIAPPTEWFITNTFSF